MMCILHPPGFFPGCAAPVSSGAPKWKFPLWSRTRPAAAAASDFCGGLLNRLTGSRRWALLESCSRPHQRIRSLVQLYGSIRRNSSCKRLANLFLWPGMLLPVASSDRMPSISHAVPVPSQQPAAAHPPAPSSTAPARFRFTRRRARPTRRKLAKCMRA
jgi:hypothetical protein